MIKVLILEDNIEKLKDIVEKISIVTCHKNIKKVEDMISAKKELAKEKYDLFLVDIQIPERKGDKINKNGGIDLIKELRMNPNLMFPNHTIVITQHEESYNEFSDLLKNKLISFLKYDPVKTSWKEKLSEKCLEIKLSKEREQKILLFAVHGFNTRGEWKNSLATVVTENKERIIYTPWDYGDFKIKIVNPFCRKNVIKKFKEFYNQKVRNYPGAKICIIAHSFGTIVVSEALKNYPEIKFDRMIFLGSPMKKDYKWNEVKEKVDKVMFYIGRKDIPLTFSWIIGLGNAGKKGFVEEHSFLKYKKYESLTHSGMFGEKHMEDEWLPFLKN